MKYPITPGYLARVPEPMVKLYQDLEDSILEYICEQFKTGDANEKSIELIRQLQRRGLSLRQIEKRIKKTLNLTQKELDAIYNGAISRNQAFFQDTLTKMRLVLSKKSRKALDAEVEAIRKQTAGEFQNITRSMGFAIRGTDGKVTVSDIGKSYQKILNDAALQIQSGAMDYNSAIRLATEKLANSGLQWIDYPSGWHNRIEVAARRAIMTGVSQVSAKYSESLIEETDAEYVEVSAHRGARDTGTGAKNHKAWQGKVYHIGGAKTYNGKRYKDFQTTTGYGTGEGLNGWNCRHKFYPFIPDIMEETYTQEELDNIDPPPFKFEGREYTAYEATQFQRSLETSMRSVQRRMIAYKASGDTDAYTQAGARYKRLKQEYIAFSKKAELPLQWERTKIYEH